MNIPICCVPFALLVAVALPGQDPAPPLGPTSELVSITGNSGLQPSLDGNGLIGAGPDYAAYFTDRGMRFEPALGNAVETVQHLTLTPTSVRRGTTRVLGLPSFAPVERHGLVACYPHAPGASEHYDVRPHGVELSWRFEQPLAGDGDLVVRYAIDTSLPAPTAADGGLRFELPDVGGVAIGRVTGIDARGNKVDGGVRCVDGALELSLPAAFVATATYPLVLDPTIGAVFAVSTGFPDPEPDVAYDEPSNRYLVVWKRLMGSNNAHIRAQLVSSQGGLVGGLITVNNTDLGARPRVANLGSRSRFGVAWSQDNSLFSSVEFAAVSASTGVVTHTGQLAFGFAGRFADVDIGCETGSAAHGFVVAYEDSGVAAAIQVQRVSFNVLDNMALGAAVPTLVDGAGYTYTQPALSRTAAADGRLLLVARRRHAASNETAIHAVVVATDGSASGPNATLIASTLIDYSVPDVDGYAGQWVVAWQEPSTRIRIVPVFINIGPIFNTLSVGTSTSLGGSSTSQATVPSVGYTPGKTWLGHRSSSIFAGSTALRATGLDSYSCGACNDTFSRPITGPETRIVVGTMTSGGRTSGEEALAVWSEGSGVLGQRLRNHNFSGLQTNLGGQCGAGGTQSFSHTTSIGSSGLVLSVNSLPPGAILTVFNVSPPGVNAACGPCVWNPFAGTVVLPVTAGGASLEVPIPCLLSWIGTQFETQWTTMDLSQAPCSLATGYVITDRVLHTVGM